MKDYYLNDLLEKEMNIIPEVIHDLLRPIDKEYKCFATGSMRFGIHNTDSDIDIVLYVPEESSFKTYNFLRDHPNRIDHGSFSSKFSIKIELENKQKVDIIYCMYESDFIDWYYATLETHYDIVNTTKNYSNKPKRVKQFEMYKEKCDILRRSRKHELGERFLWFCNNSIKDRSSYTIIKDRLLSAVKVCKMNNDDFLNKLSEEYTYFTYPAGLTTLAGDPLKTTEQQKETEMSDSKLAVEVIEKLDSAKIIAATPGVTNDAIEVTIDNEDNIIYIDVSDPKDMDEDIKNTIDFKKSTKVTLDKKYDVNSAKVKLENGLLTITVNTNKDRIRKVQVG